MQDYVKYFCKMQDYATLCKMQNEDFCKMYICKMQDYVRCNLSMQYIYAVLGFLLLCNLMQHAMCNVLEMFTNLTKLDETPIPWDETLFRWTKRLFRWTKR